jgi:hypothetical protein
MADTTITSANSVLTLVAAGLFPAPQRIQGFSTDRAFTTEAVAQAEVSMGVDGRLTAGFTPNPVVQTITLQADSPSKKIFLAILQAQKTAREIYYLNVTVSLPSTGESFAMTRGVLSTAKNIPDAQKVLQPMDFVITWERVDAAVL